MANIQQGTVTAVDNPSYMCSVDHVPLVYENLVHLLDRTAAELGDKPAHVFRLLKGEAKDDSLVRKVVTFKDMADKSLAVAASLLEVGMKPGDTLAIAANNCPEWLYVEYACLRIKVIMFRLPINIIEKNALIPTLRKFSCRTLVVDENVALKIEPFIHNFFKGSSDDLKDLKNIFVLDKLPAGIPFPKAIRTINDLIKSSSDNTKVVEIQMTIDPEDDAVVFPTSGSTGQPKFILFSHFACINQSFNKLLLAGRVEGEILFNERPFSWAGGRVFGPLFSRLKMVYLDSRLTLGRRSIDIIYKVMDEEAVTAAVFPHYILHDAANVTDVNVKLPATLKRLIAFGERLPYSLIEFAVRTFPMLILGYGCTECPWVCQTSITAGERYDEARLRWMRCSPSYEVKLTDDNGRVVPRGEPGLIHLRSVSSMSGYYLDPEATKKAKSQNGWIKTDDIGIMNQDGLIEITGRVKDIISKGTIKVYPKAIEDILLEHPKVEEVTVIGVPDRRLFQEVCACVILKPDAAEQTREEELKAFIASKMLDDSFLPKYFAFMKTFPRVETGKIDKPGLVAQTIKNLNLA